MTTLQSKKVSVIIPNYNYARFMKKRIESVLGQTYPVYELIILDDCSTDNSDKVIVSTIEKVQSKNPRTKISYIKNEKNTGKAILQWKKGFELAKGNYVWIAEADDLSNKHFLEEAMKGFEDRNVALSYTESMVINGKGLMVVPNFRFSRDKEKSGHYKKSYIKNGEDEIKEIMAIRCTIPNVSAVVFRNDKKILDYLDEAVKFKQVGDWYLYLKILEKGSISYSRKSYNKFRVHGGSVTRKSRENRSHFDEIRQLHKMLKKQYELDEKIVGFMDEEEMRVSIEHGIMK